MIDISKAQITKVKLLNSQCTVGFKIGPDAYTVESKDSPRPDFEKAFKKLIPLVKRVYSRGEDKDILPYSINVKATGEIIESVIVSVKELCKEPFENWVTYTLPRMSTDPGSVAELYDPEIKAIKKIIEHAVNFLEGERAQLDAFKDQDVEDPNEDHD